MEKVTRTRTTYRCGICGTEHRGKREASACEAGGVEARKFRVGDRVAAKERRTCPHGHSYACSGRVLRVVGPVPYEAEVHGKGFGLWTSPGHLYLYELTARCTTCRSATSVRYPACALKRSARRA